MKDMIITTSGWENIELLVDVIFERMLIKIQVLDHRSRIYKSSDR